MLKHAPLQKSLDYRPFLIAHADGTQNYSCLPSGSGLAWALFGPQATLFDAFIQRVHTAGGVAPLIGCATATDIGKRALVPYSADYVFYR